MALWHWLISAAALEVPPQLLDFPSQSLTSSVLRDSPSSADCATSDHLSSSCRRPHISEPSEPWRKTDMVKWQCLDINTLRLRQNGRNFADNIFKCIFLNENVWISIKISLNFVPKGPINNIPALVQIMAWRRPGDRPLSEAMMVNLPTHIFVTWPQWVNTVWLRQHGQHQHFQTHFRVWKLFCFDSNFTEIWSLGFN